MQAHLLHYEQLLQDFKKSVIFVRDTRNPAMEAGGIALSEEQRADSMELMTREASHLISEIDRLESQRKMHFERLQNVIHLVGHVIAMLSFPTFSPPGLRNCEY